MISSLVFFSSRCVQGRSLKPLLGLCPRPHSGKDEGRREGRRAPSYCQVYVMKYNSLISLTIYSTCNLALFS